MLYITRWLRDRERRKEVEQFMRGYNKAAGALLRGASPLAMQRLYANHMYPHQESGNTKEFDKGMREATNKFCKLRIVEDNRV